MELRNRKGTPVDPVPFLVVSVTVFLMSFSSGPFYCLTLGLGTVESVLLPAAVFVLGSIAAYRHFVWNARPELRGEIPAEYRLQRLFYAMAIVAVLLAALIVPVIFS